MATLRSTISAGRAVIEEIHCAVIADMDMTRVGLKGSPTKVSKTFVPDRGKHGILIQGKSPEDSAPRACWAFGGAASDFLRWPFMKELNSYHNIWVYLETKQGALSNVGLELLTPGRMLADATGEKLVGILIGDGVSRLAQEVISHGADSVIVVDAPEFAWRETERYTSALEELAEKYAPSALLLGATNHGRDIGPRAQLPAAHRSDGRLHRYLPGR